MVLRDAAGEEEEGANESMLSQQEVVLGGGALCGWCRSRNMVSMSKTKKNQNKPKRSFWRQPWQPGKSTQHMASGRSASKSWFYPV